MSNKILRHSFSFFIERLVEQFYVIVLILLQQKQVDHKPCFFPGDQNHPSQPDLRSPYATTLRRDLRRLVREHREAPGAGHHTFHLLELLELPNLLGDETSSAVDQSASKLQYASPDLKRRRPANLGQCPAHVRSTKEGQ